MTKIERLQEELEYFKFQMEIAATDKRVAFLNNCIINCEARIAKLYNEQYDKRD